MAQIGQEQQQNPFKDRRDKTRQGKVPLQGCRRKKQAFSSGPWWLAVDYTSEGAARSEN